MNKYYEEPENLITRTSRNEDLYKEISKSELDNYSIKSNATILGDNKNEIDVEKIKKILDTKYNEAPKRRTIQIEEEEEPIIEREDTKEYDIKSILEKAKEEKKVNYEEERLKKLRNTQFNILKDLDIDSNSSKSENNSEENDLVSLINTITFNESHNKMVNETDPLDILSDLKGSDNTQVLDGLKETIDKNEIIDKTADIKKPELENSFYTQSNKISSNDFVENDFKDVEEGMSLTIKIILAIVIIAFVVGIALVLKSILG